MKTSFVAFLPDSREFVKEIHVDVRTGSHQHEFQSMVRDALHHHGFVTHRTDPKTMKVPVYRCVVENAQLVRKLEGQWTVDVPLKPWTEDEALKEIEVILSNLPEEFRGYVSTEAYDRGSGYDEIISYARSIADSLEPLITKYTARIKGKK